MTDFLERRCHKRVRLFLRADLAGREAAVRDISLGGVGLDATSGSLFAPGQSVDLELVLGEERVRVPGEIVIGHGGTGVRFTRLDQQALTKILHVVASA